MKMSFKDLFSTTNNIFVFKSFKDIDKLFFLALIVYTFSATTLFAELFGIFLNGFWHCFASVGLMVVIFVPFLFLKNVKIFFYLVMAFNGLSLMILSFMDVWNSHNWWNGWFVALGIVIFIYSLLQLKKILVNHDE